MECPVCNKAMKVEDFGVVQVNVCADGCKGIWFACGELAKLDQDNEGVGKALDDALASPRSRSERQGDLDCPACRISMHHHQYKAQKGVSIDECYKCGGIFIDSGELKAIREHPMSDADHEAYVQGLLDNVPAYQKAEHDLKRAEQRTRALRNFGGVMRSNFFTMPF